MRVNGIKQQQQQQRYSIYGASPPLDPCIQAMIDVDKRTPILNESTDCEIGLEIFIRRVCAWTCVGTIIAAIGTAITAPIFLTLLSEGSVDRNSQIVLYFGIGFVGMFVMRKVILLDVPLVHTNEYDGIEVTNSLSRCFFWSVYFFFMGICVVPPGIVISIYDIRIMAIVQVLNLIVQLSFISFSMLPKFSEFFLYWGLPLSCVAISCIFFGLFVLVDGVGTLHMYPWYLYATYAGGALMFAVILSAYIKHCFDTYAKGAPDHLYMCMTFWNSPFFVLLSYISSVGHCIAFSTRSRIYETAKRVAESRKARESPR